jgi:hypothetical protein
MKNKLLLLVIGLIMTTQMIYSQVPSHVPTNGLLSYWPFNGNANDQSGNNYNGIVNGATLTSDRNGNVRSAYSFNGASNYIKLPKITPLNDASSFTFSCWILPTGSTGTRQFVLSRGYDYSTGSFFISQECEANSNYIRFSYNGYPNYNILSQQGYSIPYQNWQLLTVTKSATTVNMYINSVLVNSSTNTSNLMTEDEFLYIGSHWFNNQDGSFFPYYFKGLIDDVGIWNRALTSTEIQQLYTTCTTPVPTGSASQTLCSGSTVANLTATGTNIKWYATSTGATALASTTALVNGTTYYASQTVNGCESTARMSVVVTLNNPTVSASITLTYGNDYQVINEMCPIQEITYTLSGGATGVTVVGLPYGVNVSTVGTTVTISSSFMHIPIGYYNFTITTTGGCGTSSVNGYIIVIPNSPPPTLSSSIGTDNQTVCLGASIQNISYTINSGNVSVYNLPPGVNYTLNGQEIIITGTPSQAGVYNYNIFDPGNGNGCLFIPTQGTITVNPSPSAPIIGVITQPTCSTPTGNVVLTGLPSGNWTINPGGITGSTTTATLSGLPAGAYNYTVTNASGCISSASANVIINPPVSATITLTSGNEYQVINQMCQIQEITYTLSGGATGVTVVGLPDGVNVSTVGTTVIISSSFMFFPVGQYNFTITTTGGCGTSSVNGIISVMPLSIPALSSPIGTDNQSVCLGTSIQNISYTINMMNIGNVSIQNLPVGVNYTFNGQEIIITGTPTQAGVYNYNIYEQPIGLMCVIFSTQGTITVNPTPSAPIIETITQTTCETQLGSVVLTGLPSGNWTINPGGITGSTTTATLSVLSAGAYNYTVTNASGCISSASANVIINPPVSVTPTFTSISPICSGDIVQVLPSVSTNGISGTWSPALNNIATTTYTFTPDPANIGSNLIGNGDFSAGNAGFNSDYAFTISNGPNGNQGSYGVVSNANTWFTPFNNCPGNGNFLIADGSIRNDSKVWEQTVNVLPNHNYVFSYNLQTIALPNPANIDIKVNGVSIGIDTAPSTICGTSSFSHVWNSGSNTTATIAIFDNVILANGNDFAIDDISFTQVAQQCSTTATMTITVIPCSPIPTCGENFFDNGGVTANYTNGITAATGTTIICPNNPGNVVTVNFTSFATESGWDFLKIYDGNSSTAILLGNFSGTTIPGTFTASTASGCLTFVFTSDATLTAAGWNANVTCAPPATCSKPNTLTATAITQFTALLGWFQPANPNGSFALASQVIAVPCGSVAPTASTIGWINAPSNPFNLTGLNSASCYEFYVRSVCSPTDASLISGPFSFNTLIANDECVGAITVPVNQNTNCLQTVVGSLSLATASPEANSCGATLDEDDVWFKFTATATSHYISLLGVNYTATPTGLSYAIYTGSCGSLTQFGGCTANSSASTNPSLNGLTIGATYYIRVYSTGTTAVTTTFELCIGTNVGNCNSALPLCVIQPIILPNSVGVPTLPNPISPFSTTNATVGCLGSAPSPTFFNLQIPANGNYNFFLEQNTNSAFTGTGIDVDFVAWGPFASNAAACAGITTGNAPATGISCSYSINFTENFVVNNAIAGQIYVVMVTNYNGRKGFIKITQTAGAVPTACCPFGNFAYSNTSFSKDGVNPSPVFTNNATAGVFSAVPTGLSINSTTGLINLARSPLGTYVVHNTIASSGTCPGDDDTWTITITEQTSATIDYSGSPFCNSSTLGNVTLTGTGAYTGGTFSSQPNGLSINSATGEIMLYQSAVGSYTVTYTIPASNGNPMLTTSTTVLVNTAPWAVFTYGDICETSLTLPIFAGGAYIGGTFSSQPDGLWINPVTGVINARTSYPGNYTVTYTIPASGGCPSIETTENITINPIPTATISGTRTVCIGDSATVIFNGTPNASVTYTVDGGAIQTIVLDNAGNATLTTSPFANCTYSLVSVSSNGTSWCTEPLAGTVTITVNPRPVNIAIAPSSQSICSGTAAYIDIYSNSIGTEFFWTADVNNVTGATSGYGNYISQTLTTTGTLPGTVTYIITPYNYNNVCAGEIISIQITVNPIPVVTASSSHQTICSGNTANINLSSSVVGTTFSWTADEYNVVGASSGTGSSIAQTLITLGNSRGSVTYTITPSNNGCLGVPTIATVAVNPFPTVTVPTNATYSNNAIVPASDFGSTLPGTSFYWTNDNINIGLAAAGTGNTFAFTAINTTNAPITANITVTPSYYSSSGNGCIGTPSTYSITVLPTTTIGNISITSSNNTIGLFDTVTVDVQLTNASDLYSLYMKLKGNLAVSQYLDYSGYTASTLLGSSADVIATDPIVTNGVYDFGITKIGNVSGYSGSGLFYTFRFVTKNIPIPAGTNFCFYLDEISAYNTAGTPSGLTNQGQYCYTFSNQTNVWPGDLNKSNTVTTADLLPIGYFYNSTGATRPNATILWTAQPAVLWGYNHSSINGNGYKVFADSNGDGVINNADQAAIGRNMNQIHARLASPYPIQHTTQLSSALSNGDLMVTPDNAIVNALASQTITFSVSLNNTGGLNGLYGISVNLLFDNTIFDLSTASIDYTGSIFGTAGTDCLVINHTSSSMESVGLTRYANAAINGQGLLFKVTLQTRFPFTSPLNQTLVSSYVEAANNQNGDPLVIQDAPVTNIIITNNLGVNTIKSNEFVLYPNPANEVVNLVMGTNTTELNGLKLKVINVLGQTVEKMNIQNTSMEISTRNWGASGVYFVEITNENNTILMTKKVIVVRK